MLCFRSFFLPSLPVVVVAVVTPRLPQNGAWRKTMQHWKPGNFPRPGPPGRKLGKVDGGKDCLRTRLGLVNPSAMN